MSEAQPLLDEERPATTEEDKGFDDGYADWSNTFRAFEEALFHGSLYVILGISFYSFILGTNLTVIQSVYFAVSVFTTVGYGDISPAVSNASMIFTIFFALYGIVILGIFLGVVGDYFVNKEQQVVDDLKKKAKNKYLELISTKAEGIIEEEEEEEEYEEDSSVYKFLAKYDLFLADLYLIAVNQKILILGVLVFGIPLMIAENWSIVQFLYWLVITGTTIGLGDLTPEGKFANFYCIGYIPFAVVLVGKILGNIAISYVEKRNDKTEENFLNRALDESAMEKMDTDNDSEVSKVEFLIFMLKTLGKVEDDDVQKVMEIFDKLDKDKSGSLSKEDIHFIPNQTSTLVDRLKKKRG
jgi:potassium channel subfamily K